MKQTPEVRMLLRLKKSYIIQKAKELGLATSGSKLSIAIKVATKQEEMISRIWSNIAGRK